MPNFVDSYISIATLVAWILVSAWGIANIRRHWRSLFYEKTAATITGIRTREERWSRSDAAGWETWYLTNFSYKFEVNGENYKGDSEGDFIGSHSAIQKGEKSVGDAVDILYDPQAPERNCHSRAGIGAGAFLLIFAQSLLAIAVYHTLESWPEPREPDIEFAESEFPLAGSWYGNIYVTRSGSYTARLTLHNAIEGVPSGRIRYSPTGCRTLVRFVGERDARFTYREQHEAGYCSGLKTIELWRRPNGSLDWLSHREDGSHEGKGRLELTQR